MRDRKGRDLSRPTWSPVEGIQNEGIDSCAHGLGEDGVQGSGDVHLQGIGLEAYDRRGCGGVMSQEIELGLVQWIEQDPDMRGARESLSEQLQTLHRDFRPCHRHSRHVAAGTSQRRHQAASNRPPAVDDEVAAFDPTEISEPAIGSLPPTPRARG
jgi:hypothetical protein